MEIERKQKQIAAKKREVEQTKHAKQNLLKQGEVEKAKLEIQEKESQTLLANLKKKQKGIQSEIRKKKRSAEQLNAQEALHTSTQIIIAPGYEYKIVKAMVTNFHQPQSTLLLLVSAFVHKGNPKETEHRGKDHISSHFFGKPKINAKHQNKQ